MKSKINIYKPKTPMVEDSNNMTVVLTDIDESSVETTSNSPQYRPRTWMITN